MAGPSDTFNGFTPQALRFFRNLAANNNKEWFEAHRRQYQSAVLLPMRACALSLSAFMFKLDPGIEFHPTRAVARINRDTRFSRDKTPYRTNLWFSFKRFSQNWQGYPTWFFELDASCYRYGMGFYSAPKSTMDALRQELAYRPAAFKKAIAPFYHLGKFVVDGASYARPQKPEVAADLALFRQFKSFYVAHTAPPDALLFSPRLVNEIKAGFKSLSPFYNYLWKMIEGREQESRLAAGA